MIAMFFVLIRERVVLIVVVITEYLKVLVIVCFEHRQEEVDAGVTPKVARHVLDP